MQRLTLCSWSIRHPVAVVIVFCLLSAVFVWGNSVSKRAVFSIATSSSVGMTHFSYGSLRSGKVREGFEGRVYSIRIEYWRPLPRMPRDSPRHTGGAKNIW